MTLNKAQKLVRMVELMTRPGGVTAAELVDSFELDARSLRRYLSDLRELALPVLDEGRGDERVISVDPRWRRAGVQLTLAELLSLHFGRTLFDFLDGTSFAEDIEDAIERLQPAISRTHQDLARQLETKFLCVPEHRKDYRGKANELIDTAISALVYNNPLHARYRKPSGVEGGYVLHPFTLATYRQGLYLFALDVEAAQVKTFALERFTELVRSREHFTYPPGWQPQGHIAHAFGIISGPPEDVAIAFSHEVGRYVRERTWHPTQTFATGPDGRLELRLHVAVTVELEQWIRGFGEHAQVVGPAALVDRIRTSLERAAAAYGAGS